MHLETLADIQENIQGHRPQRAMLRSTWTQNSEILSSTSGKSTRTPPRPSSDSVGGTSATKTSEFKMAAAFIDSSESGSYVLK